MSTHTIIRSFAILGIIISSAVIHAQDPLSMIPQDANMIAHWNMKNLYSKSSYEEIKQMEFFKAIDDEVKKEFERNKETQKYEIISQLYKNPAASGVNINSSIYYFVKYDKNIFSTDYNSSERPGIELSFIIPINNLKTFDVLMKKGFEIQKEGKIQKTGKTQYISEQGFTVLWNASYCIINLNSAAYSYSYGLSKKEEAAQKKKAIADAKERVNSILHPNTENSISKNNDYKAFLAKDYDIGIWSHTGSLLSTETLYKLSPSDIYDNMPILKDNPFKGLTSQTGMKFINGEIVFENTTKYNEVLSAKISPIYNSKQDMNMLRFIKPGQTLALGSISFNMQELKKLMQTEAKPLCDKFQKEYPKILYERELRKDPSIKAINDQVDSVDVQLYGSKVDYSEIAADTVAIAVDSVAISDTYDDAPEETPAYDTTAYQDYESADYNSGDYDGSYQYVNRDSLYDLRDSLSTILDHTKDSLAIIMLHKDGFEEDDIWDLFDGNILAAVTAIDIREKKYLSYKYDADMNYTEDSIMSKVPVPIYTVVFACNETDKVKKLVKKAVEFGGIKNEGSYYTLLVPDDFPDNTHYLYFSGKYLVITNNKDLVQHNINGYKGATMDALLTKNIQDNNSFLYIDINKIMIATVSTYGSDKNIETGKMVASFFNDIESYAKFSSEGSVSGVSSIGLTNKSNNSLFELFRLFNEVYKVMEMNKKY